MWGATVVELSALILSRWTRAISLSCALRQKCRQVRASHTKVRILLSQVRHHLGGRGAPPRDDRVLRRRERRGERCGVVLVLTITTAP